MKGFALRLALKQRHKRTRKWPIKINALSICPAAGQVVENTPCPAVKFFVNFQFIMLNPCLYGWNVDYFHRSVNFCELGTRYLQLWSFLRTSGHEIVNTPCPARQSNISRILSHSTQNIRALSDAALVCTAQGYDYHRNTSVLFLPFIALFSNGFRTQNRKYSVSGSRIVSRQLVQGSTSPLAR